MLSLQRKRWKKDPCRAIEGKRKNSGNLIESIIFCKSDTNKLSIKYDKHIRMKTRKSSTENELDPWRIVEKKMGKTLTLLFQCVHYNFIAFHFINVLCFSSGLVAIRIKYSQWKTQRPKKYRKAATKNSDFIHFLFRPVVRKVLLCFLLFMLQLVQLVKAFKER